MNYDLNSVLKPRSVALIGASRNPTSFSYTYLSIILRYGYKGSIYPINPNAKTILQHKCYPSILDVPESIDLGIVVVPRKATATVVKECIQKGVKGIIILTGGFAEVDDEGRRIQVEIVKKAKTNGVRILGPNCLGLYSAPADFDGLLSGFLKKGSIALVSQSGNLTRSMAFPGVKRGIGFSYIISLGNTSDIQFHEIVKYLRNDEYTNAIALFIEGLTDGREFMREVNETVKVKPVVVMKAGRTEVGAKAVSSHTGSLAGSDEVYDAAFRQCGAIRVNNFLEFNSTMLALSSGKIPKGNRIGLLSEGGGDTSITSDECMLSGLEIPSFPKEKQKKLREIIPSMGTVRNPVDLAMWQHIPEVAKIMLEGDDIDGLLIVGGFAGWDILNPNVAEEVENSAELMANLYARTEKPILIYSYYSYEERKAFKIMKERGIPLFLDHQDAVKSMEALVKYASIKEKAASRSFSSDIAGWKKPGVKLDGFKDKILLEPDAKKLLRKYRIQSPDFRIAERASEAVQYSKELGYPVVMKIISPDIVHKSEAGGVKLGLMNNDEVEKAYQKIISNAVKYKSDVRIKGVLISQMEVGGVEAIIGGLQDPTFGPTVMFGLGGIFVEILRDVSFRIAPINRSIANEMIKEIRSYRVLEGARGQKPVDIEGVKDTLIKVSQILLDNPEISQLDLNPIRIHEKGISALDARILLK